MDTKIANLVKAQLAHKKLDTKKQRRKQQENGGFETIKHLAKGYIDEADVLLQSEFGKTHQGTRIKFSKNYSDRRSMIEFVIGDEQMIAFYQWTIVICWKIVRFRLEHQLFVKTVTKKCMGNRT